MIAADGREYKFQWFLPRKFGAFMIFFIPGAQVLPLQFAYARHAAQLYLGIAGSLSLEANKDTGYRYPLLLCQDRAVLPLQVVVSSSFV